jgi:hypothetical protein
MSGVRYWSLLALLVSNLGGCGSSADSMSSPKAVAGSSGANGGSGGAGGIADGEPVPDTLVFSPSDPLTLVPTGTQQLTVVAAPPAAYVVHFALIGSAPGMGVGDGALDASKQITDGDGRTTVTLTAPSMPMSFNVRASVGPSLQALLGVTVNGTNETTLLVLHSYAGHRKVQEWTASIWPLTDCSALSGPIPPDGDDTASVSTSQQLPLVLEHVPVGKDLAVALHAGHYIGGCVNVAALSEGNANQATVFASDRPINLADTTLDVAFGFGAQSSALSTLLGGAVDESVSALTSGKSDDVSALLDAMHDATPSTDRDAFDTARSAGNWDAALGAAYGGGAQSRLRDAVRGWLNTGMLKFTQPDTFAGTLSSYSATDARLALSTVAGMAPADVGFSLGPSSSWAVTWAADSNDNLLLSAELGWVPSLLVTGLASAPAIAAYPSATTVESALAQVADCALTASVALANGTSPGLAAYTGCDETCVETACTQALGALWQNARNASGSEAATLTVIVTGASEVGDEANVVSTQGSWVGKLTVGDTSASADGPFSGMAPP